MAVSVMTAKRKPRQSSSHQASSLQVGDVDKLRRWIFLPFDPYWAFNMRRSARFQLWVLTGHCMEPTLPHGSLIFVRRLKPKHGSIVHATVDGKHMIKRYLIEAGKPVLRADNPKYPMPTWEHEMKVLGVVLGSWRSLRCARSQAVAQTALLNSAGDSAQSAVRSAVR